MFFTICVLKNFAIFTGKRLCQSLFFNKVVDLDASCLEHLRLLLSNLNNRLCLLHLVVWFYFVHAVLNPYQSNVAFHIETSHFIYTANQITDFFYMNCKTGLKLVNNRFSGFTLSTTESATQSFIFPIKTPMIG